MRMNVLISVALCLVNVGYAADVPTACNPNYDKPEYWDQAYVKKAYFHGQEWPKARRLYYVDGWGYLNEDGSRAESKADAEIDMVVISPEAATERGFKQPAEPLLVSPKFTPVETFRHLTVEPGGHLWLQTFEAHGNVWIKRGGSMSTHATGGFVGERHTFLRNDNHHAEYFAGTDGMRSLDKVHGVPEAKEYHESRLNNKDGQLKYGPKIVRLVDAAGRWKWSKANLGGHLGVAHFGEIKKAAKATVEVVGHVWFATRLDILGGALIAGPDTVIHAGDVKYPMKVAGGLILLDNAYFSRTNPGASKKADIVVDATGYIQAGLPERPLMRDCFLCLAMADGQDGSSCSMEAKGTVKVSSADPAKARLVFVGDGRFLAGKAEAESGPVAATRSGGICIRFANPEIRLNGVVFDDVIPKGLWVASPAQRESWENIFLGEHCAGKPEERFFYGTGGAK